MKIFKKKSFWIITVIVIVIVAGIIYKNSKPVLPVYDIVEAVQGELIQEVSITGSVKAADEVTLSVEKSGKVDYLPIKVGDFIKEGQTLLRLSNADLGAQYQQAAANIEQAKAQLLQYEATLATQQATLNEYILGTRAEELQIKQTAVKTAEIAVQDAKSSLTDAEASAESALNQYYDAVLNTMAYSISKAENTIYTISDIQTTYFTGTDQDSSQFASAKEQMISVLWGEPNAGRWNKSNLSGLTGGAKGILINAQVNPTQEVIDFALISVKNAIQTIKNQLNNIPITINMTSTDIATINTEKTYIDTEIASLTTKQQAISIQKTTNASNITTAQTNINVKENALQTTRDQLLLAQAGYTTEQIASQQARVDQAIANVASQKASIKAAEANAYNYSAQIAKTFIKSPINGIVTDVETKVGEIVSMNTPIIKIISEAEFQIEANVPEVDIANIKIGDEATVSLDAYNDSTFIAKVITIDPAETLIDSVPTYKVTFQFTENNDLIRSGMTANLDILTEKKDNVVNVPQRSILKSNGDKIIRVLQPDGINFDEVIITTGLRGSNGNVEIIDGIKAGDKIILSIKSN